MALSSMKTSNPTPAEARKGALPLPPGLPPAELQRLWFAVARTEWSSLVLVPASPDVSTGAIAESLAKIAELQRGRPVKVIGGDELTLEESARFIVEMTAHTASGGMVIVAVPAFSQSMAGVPVALAADAAVLCVRLEKTTLAAARATLEAAGKDRFLGCITVGP